MLEAWQAFLTQQGAVVESGAVTGFGKPDTEYQALETGAILCDLSHFGLIHFAGEDTARFLNGQLSSDVERLAEDANQYSSHSTPKGRMLATFLIWRELGGYTLQVAGDLREAMQKRLSMYILRSKVKPGDLPGRSVLLGLAGPTAASALKAAFGVEGLEEQQTVQSGNHTILRTTGDRYELRIDAAEAPAVWSALAALATPAGRDAWTLSEVRAGIPWVSAATQEQFVPQMANLELLGGVSFNKGCYTGQEIVARTQYLGKLKRRAYRVHSDAPLTAGDAVFSPDMHGQAIGMVVNAAPLPAGGWEALAVAQSSSVEHGLHVASVDGPALTVEPLPYALS